MRFLYVSPAVERMTGRPPSHYVGKTLREVGLSDNYVPAFEAAVRTALAGEESTIEYSFMATGRGPRVLEGRLAPEFGPGEGPRAVIAVTRDITALREAEARLREEAAALERANERLAALSRHDPLTGLANRRYLMEYLATEWRREARHDALISMVLADIDHFKAYNDRYGHLAGDECLRRVAGALRTQAHRPGDLLARYGGEEFVLIMPETPLAGARRVAEALRAAVQGLQIEHAASPTAPHVTISLGVAEVAPRSQSADELFARADAAMYAAKSRGRNRVNIAGED